MIKEKKKRIKFIDLFAGIGSTRIGFEQACNELGLIPECVLTSEIKDHAISVYERNFLGHKVSGDITKIDSSYIPEFDFLLGGFPCQSFSSAGARRGFLDTRGTLFFEVERIIRDKNPMGFLLENVEGLVNHDKVDSTTSIGRTLETIINNLSNLGYNITWKVLNSADFGVAQERKRIYIVGSKENKINLDNFPIQKRHYVKDIVEKGKDTISNNFTKNLFKYYKPTDLYGKCIKDKRGSSSNIHSWEIDLKGTTTDTQKNILNQLLKERRKKQWGINKGIKWMDGMPLTLEEIGTFINLERKELKKLLDDLVEKKYLVFEHPKDEIEYIDIKGNKLKKREYATNIPKGYNIVAGKLSFPINKILDPNGLVHTIVATDASRIGVIDNNGIRNLTIKEGKRLFGLDDNFIIDVPYLKALDLLGNTVVVPVIKEVSKKLLSPILKL